MPNYERIPPSTIAKAPKELVYYMEQYNNSISQAYAASLSIHMPWKHLDEIEARIEGYYQKVKEWLIANNLIDGIRTPQ